VFRSSVRVGPDSHHHCALSPNNRHSEIMAIGWKRLGAELKTEKTASSILGLIKDTAEGHTPHRADALRFGLYKNLRQKGPAKSALALLRCTDEKCLASKNPIYYNTLEGKIGCPRHLSAVQTLKCSECDRARDDYCTWCKGCRRVFE